jgi:[ribosomal protein S5]-alanine N-acetyltransferase
MIEMAIIKGKGFILRPIRLEDAKDYFECQNDDVAKEMFMSNPKNIKEARKEIQEQLDNMKSKKPTQEGFAINIDGKFAGMIWIDDISYGFFKHRVGMGYCVHKNFRGRGIGSTAIKLLTDYAFKKYKLKRIAITTRDFNIGSRKALEKAGYKLEGILMKNKFKNGKYLNDCIYAIVK